MPDRKQKLSTDYLPRKFITPITGTLSLVIGTSGGMMFFHVGESLVKETHEWLGMAFVPVMLAHLAINWKAFTIHFHKPVAWVSTGIVTAISTAFLITALTTSSPSPMRQIIQIIETTAINDLAPVFKVSESEIRQKLSQSGIQVKTGKETLQQLAEQNGIDPRRLMVTLTHFENPKNGI